MNVNNLFESLQNVDEEILLRSESPAPRPYSRIIAASLAALLCLLGLSRLLAPGDPDSPTDTWFAVKAYAQDGTQAELTQNNGVLNSGGNGKNIFGVDQPLFSFDLGPVRRENAPLPFSDYSVTVSYNGKSADKKDDHLLIVYNLPLAGTSGEQTCGILGWFSEPTDITILITDKSTQTAIETLFMHIRYDTSAGAYELTLTGQKNMN